MRRSYLLALAGSLLFAGVYAVQRDLRAQVDEYRRTQELTQSTRAQLEELKRVEGEMREYVHGLEANPIEFEANIRKTKDMARQGERVYRFKVREEKPSQ